MVRGVTFDEALLELGLKDDVTSEQVRRAYLRLLWTRRPEVDQEGFLRLREAYELARTILTWREAAGLWADGDGESLTDTSPVAPASPVAPVGEPDLGYEVALDACAFPLPPVATPEQVPEPPPSAAPSSRDFASVRILTPHAIEALVSDGRLVEAAQRLLKCYRQLTDHIDLDAPPVLTTLDIVLRLHEKGELDMAERLQSAFEQWMGASASEAKILEGRGVFWWAVIRELAALPRALETEVRTAIAQATRENNLLAARRPLGLFALRSPAQAKATWGLLKWHAPLLAKELGPALTVGKDESSAPRWRTDVSQLDWGHSLALGLPSLRFFTLRWVGDVKKRKFGEVVQWWDRKPNRRPLSCPWTQSGPFHTTFLMTLMRG